MNSTPGVLSACCHLWIHFMSMCVVQLPFSDSILHHKNLNFPLKFLITIMTWDTRSRSSSCAKQGRFSSNGEEETYDIPWVEPSKLHRANWHGHFLEVTNRYDPFLLWMQKWGVHNCPFSSRQNKNKLLVLLHVKLECYFGIIHTFSSKDIII